MCKRRFVFFSGPVEDVWADCLELGEFGDEDFDIEIMSQVDPGRNEHGKVGPNERVVNVIESF